MTDKGLNSLMSTTFKVGGDASIVAGPVGAGAKSTGTGGPRVVHALERRLWRCESRRHRCARQYQVQWRVLRCEEGGAAAGRRHAACVQETSAAPLPNAVAKVAGK